MVFTRPVFNPQHWPIYREVNGLFARAVLQEAGSDPAFVFVQDYHFGLLPRLLKDSGSNLIVAQFWHIPWPSPQVFQTFPWKHELLEGLLGNDLLGFHLRSHCQYFLDTVDHLLEAKVDYERFEVTRGGKVTVVRAFPISIDVEEHEALAGSSTVTTEMDRWRQQLGLGEEILGLGIDRIDYTKGIPERLRALDLFLEKHPEYRQRLVFIQIGVPSRSHVPQYRVLDDLLDSLVEEINWKWGTDSWRPIQYLKQQYGPLQMMALHRLAAFAMVTSLDDGMNLVAKEFVTSRLDGDGALILSCFTGAARELTSALVVNPFSIEEMAEAIHQALIMPEEERRNGCRRCARPWQRTISIAGRGNVSLPCSNSIFQKVLLWSSPKTYLDGLRALKGKEKRSLMHQHLLEVLDEVRERVTRAGHVLLGLDFDGTITPIQETPSAVSLSPEMRQILESLSQRDRLSVAILTGRERADMRERVDIPGLLYVGNHGLEISGPGLLHIDPTAADSRPAIQQLTTNLQAKLQHILGVLLEDKGLTVSVHHRLVAPEQSEEVRDIVHAALANSPHPFQLTRGAQVFEIRPRVYWNKGTAMIWLMENLGKQDILPIYLGDDTTDEDVFAALPEGLTVKVGPDADTAAGYRLDGPAEVQTFLEWLNSIMHSNPVWSPE